MNIWFDISNSPHIHLFEELIRELQSEGHSIIITSRPLANTVALLEQRGLKHTIVGDHYGKNFLKKLLGYPIRVIQLVRFLKAKRLDLAVSQSSFHSPLVASLLGIPSIYTNDNEHAMGNLPSFLFATQILIPESLAIEKVARKGVSRNKVKQYPGVKEGIYLWRKSGIATKSKNTQGKEQVKIYIRPEPLTAQYYKGGQNFLDDTISKLQGRYSITVLPRDKTQHQYYTQQKFNLITVPTSPLDFDTIAKGCTLFIGAGGSMTRELAILGIPTISVYQDDLLEVDKYLIEHGVLCHAPNLNADLVETFLRSLESKPPDNLIMAKGQQAYGLLKSEILKFNNK